jgi:phage shock protein A
MPLIRRIADIVSANLNEMVDCFEDPEKMLRQAIREMEQVLSEALDRAVKAVAQEKLLAKQVTENKRQAESWQARAVQAVEAGDDSRAKEAITRRRQHEQLVEALEDQQRAAAELSAKLRRQIAGMRAKLAETHRTLTALAAHKRVAEARKTLHLLTPSRSGLETLSHVNRWVERLELAEAEADAWCEMTGAADEDLFDQQDDVQIDRELAALKQSLGK